MLAGSWLPKDIQVLLRGPVVSVQIFLVAEASQTPRSRCQVCLKSFFPSYSHDSRVADPCSLLLQTCVSVLLLSQLYPPTKSIEECFAEKNFIILLDIHKSPLGEVQQEPPFADELSHSVE